MDWISEGIQEWDTGYIIIDEGMKGDDHKEFWTIRRNNGVYTVVCVSSKTAE